MARPPYDLVLTGGTLLEPSQGIEERRDLALADGRSRLSNRRFRPIKVSRFSTCRDCS